ncbi:alpha/beta fold hydrolase [Azohydromonas aeria]|uniref:alpha/beta fold hydrolase n=1 Tax=Azohydromonas aeria TaxID=2590212 RepID=UPI0012F731CF|nr:alpha/beta hydrolase [Azohydromonas aeria]
MSHPDSNSLRRPARGRLVALHSSASGARQWQAWRALLPASVDLVAPDLPGYGADGAAPWRAAAPTTLADEAEPLLPLLSGVEGGVHLLGHSYGGAVALELALRWPQHVRSLTLYEPVRFGVLRGAAGRAPWSEALDLGGAVRAHVRARRLHAAAALFVDYWSGDGAWALCGEGRRAAIAACMPKVDAEFGALFADTVPLRAWAGLQMPVRLLAGTRSPAPVLRVAETLAQACPRATLRHLEGLGHMGPVQAPARVAAALGFSAEEPDLEATLPGV